MLNKLTLKNAFVHKDREFVFDRGVTGVIGPNESGKSLIVEMIRFALFGSKALRGRAEDYKRLEVALDFTVAEVDYSVVRRGSKAELRQRGALMATGTTPVNEAIVDLLGYDLGVFDVANACNQGNVEALSNMTPTQRRTMVDKTVGLDQLDGLIAYCGAEGNALKREADAGRAALIEPVRPERPADYRPAAEVKDELLAAEALQTEYNQLVGATANRPSEPVEPASIDVVESAEELRAYQEQRQSDLRTQARLRAQLSKIEPEQFSEAHLDEAEVLLQMHERWVQKERLLQQGYHECPECAHRWPVADLGDLAKAEFVELRMSRRDLAGHRARIGNAAQIESLEAQLAGIEIGPDRAAVLATVEAHDRAMRTYRAARETYESFMADLDRKLARIDELEPTVWSISDLRALWQQCRDYEVADKAYQASLGAYEEAITAIGRANRLSGDYLEARRRLQDLKVEVKNFLVPSLNTVASLLLSRMTGGERYQIEVDEDFEITVDGQPVATLSGSGKAVANLAIRIALGQLLTSRVFSVFMADEVDAAMDDDRAGYTADALRRLSDTLGQVIIITHKRPDTDHTIELKAN